MSHLDARQRQALAQLRDLTDGADDDVAISVLDSVGWDVHKAADLVFGANPPSLSAMQPLDIDDTRQGDYPARPQHVSVLSSIYLAIRPILSLFAVPLHLLSNIFRFIFGVLRIPVPQLGFTTLNFYRPLPRRPRSTSQGGADRWIRELEEETGAISINRVSRGGASTTGADLAGPSSSTTRLRAYEDGRKVLPDFVLGTYEEFLRRCQTEAKIGTIILVSEEHDDVPEFKRDTLTDITLVKLLQDNDILVWGGDVRDREAWSAAERLQATTYPFVAFVALQPPRQLLTSQRSNSSLPMLTVLSRHQGPSIPSTTGPGPTSAHALTTHLTHQLLPRVMPFLARIRALQRERERDRQLREEQDKAFRDAARRDKQKIEERMAEEKRKKERELELQAEQQRKEVEAQEKRKREEIRMQWRRWLRRKTHQQSVPSNAKALRIAVRLPSGARVVSSFEESATLTDLYIFVDTQLIPATLGAAEDPDSLPYPETSEAEAAVEACLATEGAEWWGFSLVQAFPRKDIPWVSGIRLNEVDGLKGGGQVVVELLESAKSNSIDDEDDDSELED